MRIIVGLKLQLGAQLSQAALEQTAYGITSGATRADGDLDDDTDVDFQDFLILQSNFGNTADAVTSMVMESADTALPDAVTAVSHSGSVGADSAGPTEVRQTLAGLATGAAQRSPADDAAVDAALDDLDSRWLLHELFDNLPGAQLGPKRSAPSDHNHRHATPP